MEYNDLIRSRESIRNYDPSRPIPTDLAIALTHIILAAENEGIGTCWIEAYNPAILREALNLKDNEVVYGITPLGYQKAGFKKSLSKKRKPFDDIVEFL